MADLFDRYTRTPINFEHLDDVQGRTTQNLPSIANSLLSLFGHPQPDQQISVDPNAASGKSTVMKHEIAHAILNKLGNDQSLANANKNIDVFPQIAQAFGQAGFKEPQTEIPAYAASGELKNMMGMKPGWQEQYVQKLHSELLKMNPQIAKWYNSVSQGAAQ